MLKHILKPNEIEIIEQLCYEESEMNSKGYKSLIQLNIYRRTIVAYVLKFNNEAMEQISDIMNKCHMSHINVAY